MHRSKLLSPALLCLLAWVVTGCGFNSGSSSCNPGTLVSQASSGANFSLVPLNYDFSLYPGQTAQFPVLVAPVGNATGQVTIRPGNLPQGITIDTATVAIGSTAQLNVHAALNVEAACFTGSSFTYTAGGAIALVATNSSGSYNEQVPITVVLENPTFVPSTPSGLPVFNITTDGAAPIDSEDDYVDATLQVTDTANPSNNYSGTMGIRGRGNTTWEMPKKPYRLDLDSKVPLLGMNSSDDWVMLANYDDKPMIRNDLAFHVSKLFGMAWTPNSAFVELYLNGQYEGVYQLSEKVQVSKARLNIGSIDDTDNSGTDLTGGYIGEIDHYDGETFMMTSIVGLPIGIADPDPPTTEQSTYFATNFTAAETSLYASNFADPTTGWRSHWDQDSLVQWFLVNELMGNVDADDFSSDYFYKPRSDPNFYMGPVWDFDISSGNTYNTAIVSPAVPWVATQSRWYVQLFRDPGFVAAVKAEWTALRPQIGELPAYIDTRAAALTPAAQNNYGRWPTLGEKVIPNSEAAGSYPAEVDFLKSWITERIAYMDSKYLQQ